MAGKAIAVVLASVALLGQQTPAPAPSAAPKAIEFPVVMRQTVIAGKTPVGSEVQAKLVAATLVDGKVIPQGAVLVGEVTESVEKTAASPSRLGIRMDTAKWKKGSAAIKVYLTAWYYPVIAQNQDFSTGQPDATKGSKLRTGGAFPGGAKNPNSSPLPDPAAADEPPASPPGPTLSQHRVLMRDVEFTSNRDGGIVLTSKRSDLKLDKHTTYLFAAGGPVSSAR